MYPGMGAISRSWLPETASFSFGTLNAFVAEKPALSLPGRFCASCQEIGVFIWRSSMGVFAWPRSAFRTRLHTACTHSCPSSLPLLSIFLQLNGLYIVNLDRGPSIDSAKVVLVRPYHTSTSGSLRSISSMQLTDRRIYFSWEDARRQDIPLFKDGENKPEPSSPGSPTTAEPSPEAWPWVDPEFGG